MPPDKKKASDSTVPRETVEQQDQSIKARKNQLFEVPLPSEDEVKVKPFVVYLNATPPAPMSMPVKVTLWSLAMVVGLLFLAAVLGFGR